MNRMSAFSASGIVSDGHRCHSQSAGLLALAFSALLAFTAGAAGPQVLRGHVPDAVRSTTVIGRLPATNILRLAIALPLRNHAAMTNRLAQIYNPAGTNYHHYLTPQEFTDAFGPTERDYQAVVHFARANGLEVTELHSNRVLVDVKATAAAIERAFNVKLQLYLHPSERRSFYAPDTEPSLALDVPVLHVCGLDNYALPRPHFQTRAWRAGGEAAPGAGAGPLGTYMGNDFRAAYVPDTALTGTGQAVGLLQFDGYAAGDIAYYVALNHLPSVTLSNVLLDGFSGTPTDNGGEVEVCLDIEMAMSMAPGLAKIYVYEAGPGGTWHDILNRMATDNLAKQLSCSWYIPGGAMDTVADGIFQQMALQGQSFYNASGDDDAYCSLIDFPGDTPYITQVGGTTLSTAGPGGAWTTEKAWNWATGAGSGGGISTQYPIPSWQQGISMTANLGSLTMRNVPDVALTADQVYVRADGLDQNVGGTSCAAPLWAGFTALMNQQAAANGRPTVGFVNPALYAVGQNRGYGAAFHDIVLGNNTNRSCGSARFPAVTGYDLATGWGTPMGSSLINALAGPPDALQIIPLAGFNSTGGTNGPFTITSQTLTVTNSGTNSFNWTMANAAPWLDAAPAGGTLGPGATAGINVSLNAAASNLVVGAYSGSLWFTNLDTDVGQGRTFTLTVLGAPVIIAQPASLSVLAGSTATFTVGAVGLPPLYYQWFFGGTLLPSATNATLSLPLVSTNQAGSYSVLVSNSVGTAASANATLTVFNGPVFLNGSYLYLPIQTNGVFLANNTGVRYNAAGTGGSTGVDFWAPGTPVYNTAVGIAGVNYLNGSAPSVRGFSSMNVYNLSSGGLQHAVITAVVVPGVNFTRDISFANDAKMIRFVDTLQNTGATPLTQVATMDTADPDQDAAAVASSTYSTLNDVVSVLQSNDLVVATGPGSGITVGFGSESGCQIPSATGFNNTNAYALMTVVDPNGVSGDIDMNLVQNYGTLGAGQSESVVWYQVFGSSKTEVLTNFAETASPDPLQISPSAGFSAIGGPGGPFSITSETMTLTNAGTNSLAWSLINTSLWLNASSAAGILAPAGPAATLSVGLTAVASNLASGSYSAAILFSNQFSSVAQSRLFALKILGAPIITNQPVSQSISPGSTANFAVGAEGLAPMHYQWMFAGAPLPGATNAVLILSPVATNQAGNYFAVITNALGAATSSVASLSILTGPVFLTGNYLYLPIQTNGVFLANNTGVKFNSAGTGGATGVDFWEPGTPVYNLVVGVGGIDHLDGSSPVVCALSNLNLVNLSSGGQQHALFGGTVVPGLVFSRDISFANDSKIIRIMDTLQNTGTATLLNVVTLDTADPDQDAAAVGGMTTSTLNDVMSVSGSNDLVVATGPTSGLSVGFGTESALRIPGAVGFNNQDPYSLMTVTDPGGASADIDINLVENYGTLAPGQSQSVVWYQAFGASKAEVLTNYAANAVSDPLQIAPTSGFSASGAAGGPFTLSAQTFTLTNAGATALNWSLANTSLWLTASSTGGTLGANNSSSVTTSLNLAATNLPAGLYSATLWFTNLGTGAGQGRSFALTVLGMPIITNQPASLTVPAGAAAELGVGALGLPPLDYQWFFSGGSLPAATNALLFLPAAATNQTGNYYVVVSNLLGAATSSVATLTVVTSPTDWFTELFASGVVTNVMAFRSFTFTPDGSANVYSVCSLPALSFPTDPAGGTAVFEGDDTCAQVTLSGTNTVAIYNNRTNVLFIGSNGYLTMNAGDTSFSTTYAQHFALPRVSALFCDLNPAAGGTVSWKQMADRVAVTFQSVPVYGNPGQTNSFQMELFFNGAIRLTYLNLDTPSALVGVSAGTGQPAGFVASDFSSYGCGPQPPLITTQPQNQTVPPGGTALFAVSAGGTAPLAYSWLRNGSAIPFATNASYALTNVQVSDSGSLFNCVVTNWGGLAVSSNALLKVDGTVANDQCGSAIVIPGTGYTNAQYTTNATSLGDPGPDCIPGFGNGVWYEFTPPLAGLIEVDTFGSDFDTGLAIYTGTCGALTEAACNDDAAGLQSQVIIPVSGGTAYYLLAGGYSGYTGHLVIHLGFGAPPLLTLQPASQTVPVGSNAVFSVAASGSTPLAYTWERNGGVIAGATNASYTASNVQLSDSGSQFSCLVSNAWGTTNSRTASLSVTLSLPLVITFDDVEANSEGTLLTNGYHGLRWYNLDVLNALDVSGPSGYRAGMISASNVAFNNFGNPAGLSRSNGFDLVSGYFTAAWVNNLQLQVVGRAGGGTIYSNAYFLNTTNPTFISFKYLGVTNVAFASLAPGGSGSQFALDNLEVATNSQAFLLISGVALLPDGSIQVTANSSPGQVFRLLSSTNLTDWQTLAVFTNGTGYLQCVDRCATNSSRRFYRLVMP